MLRCIENKPKYVHTISEEETRFLAHYDGKDYYYRYNKVYHNIDIRYSSEPSDYASWTFNGVVTAYNRDYETFTTLIPKWILQRAVALV